MTIAPEDTTETLDLQDEEIDAYLSVAFAFSTGFSKGTADVTPRDVKRLTPLLKHYAKMEHPFRACVRDNRKRFGPKTEAYCAVLKDLIKGTTKWRSTERKAHLADEISEYTLEFSEDFLVWLSELTAQDVRDMIEQLETIEAQNANFSDEPGDGALLAEMYFDNGSVVEKDGVIWKTILREGTW